mgnify:CR=1 FL=1
MSDISNKFILVTITQDEARVWATGLEKKSKPETILASADKSRHHHMRMAQSHHGHASDPEEKNFFESIAVACHDAGELLVIGHGEGKANTMHKFVKFLKDKHHDLAGKVVGEINSNLVHMTEAQILAEARTWFDNHNH